MSVTADPRIGSELLGYGIESVVGRGGMGVVYRAYDPRLKRRVALKLIAPGLASDDQFRQRFLAESELAASIEHPNVVPIYYAGEVEDELVLAMRYVEGQDLKTLLREQGALEPAQAVSICAQIAGALDAAHERGLVHRDVKPSNVLLDEKDHAYLADFGLTRRLTEAGAPFGEGLSVGTPAYAAPEQIEARPVDRRADAYSLGCLLYECLTGQTPFSHGTELAVLFAHMHESPPRASESNPELGEAIDAVFAKALAKDPAERYSTCTELVEAAREALGLRETVLVRDRRPLLIAAASIVLALVAALTAFLLSRGGGGPPALNTKPTSAPKVDSLQQIDPKTNELVATFRLGSDPTGVAVGGGAVWAIHLDDNTISKLDPRTNTVAATGSAPGPKAVAFGADSVWVLDGDGRTVAQLDPRSATQLGIVVVPSSSDLLAFGSGAVWTASPLTGLVARVNPKSLSVSGSTRVPARRGALKGIAAGDGAVWVSASDIVAEQYALFRIKPESAKIVAKLPLRLGALGIGVGHGAVWVANPLGDTVSQIETSTNRVVRRIRVGRDPIAVAAGKDGVWVTNYRDGTVSRIEPKTGRVVATFTVGPYPDHIAIGEGGVWVTVHPR
jgi:serine/threonine protein kinase